MTGTIALDYTDLAVAALRMVVQLSLVGLVLTLLFRLVSPLWTGLAALTMVLFAGQEIMARQERRLAGGWAYGLGTATMLVAAGLVSLPGMMTGQILAGVEPQQAIRYPLLIMFLIAGGTGFGVLAAVLGGG